MPSSKWELGDGVNELANAVAKRDRHYKEMERVYKEALGSQNTIPDSMSAEQIKWWVEQMRQYSGIHNSGVQPLTGPTQPPQPPVTTVAKLVEKYGSERAMWTMYWNGLMDKDDRAWLSAKQKGSAPVALTEHVVLPLIGEVLIRLRELEEKLDGRDGQAEKVEG